MFGGTLTANLRLWLRAWRFIGKHTLAQRWLAAQDLKRRAKMELIAADAEVERRLAWPRNEVNRWGEL
jgi:hypothetical protein